MVTNLPAKAGDAGDVGSFPGLGRFPGEGNGNPLQYSWLENPVDRVVLVGYSPWDHKRSDMTEHNRQFFNLFLLGVFFPSVQTSLLQVSKRKFFPSKFKSRVTELVYCS